MKTALIVALLLCTSPLPLYALDPTLRGPVTLRQYYRTRDTLGFQRYLDGMVLGWELANTVLHVRQQRQLYCLPRTLLPTIPFYLQTLDTRIAKLRDQVWTPEKPHLDPDEWHIELLLLQELETTFPCPP